MPGDVVAVDVDGEAAAQGGPEVARSVVEKWRKIPEPPGRETWEPRVPLCQWRVATREKKPSRSGRIGVCRVANAVSADVYGISMV